MLSTERALLAAEAIDEIIIAQNQAATKLPADIAMVWVLSAPGTARETANDGAYSGISFDLEVIKGGIAAVRQVTAQRLVKEPGLVTKNDIAVNGPTLYYNGEDEHTDNYNYLQNDHLREMAQEPDFPLPVSSVVTDHITEIGTPAQVKGFAEFLNETGQTGQVAVVSLAPHSARVGRYLEQYRDLFSDEVGLFNAPVPIEHNPIGIMLREVRKIVKYAEQGNLARHSYFHQLGVQRVN
jgi:hypothetical protein